MRRNRRKRRKMKKKTRRRKEMTKTTVSGTACQHRIPARLSVRHLMLLKYVDAIQSAVLNSKQQIFF